MALRSELSREHIHEVPRLSVANTQGSLGYMVQRALGEEFRRGFKHEVVSIVTEVEVYPDDGAFEADEAHRALDEVDALAVDRGWDMVYVENQGWDAWSPGRSRSSASDHPQAARPGRHRGLLRRRRDSSRARRRRHHRWHRGGGRQGRVRSRSALGADRLFLTTGTDAIYRTLPRRIASASPR